MSCLYQKKLSEVVELTDVLCDSCGASCKTSMGFEYGSLRASWGYDSRKDCMVEDYHLCENCFDNIANMTIKNRFSEVLLGDE